MAETSLLRAIREDDPESMPLRRRTSADAPAVAAGPGWGSAIRVRAVRVALWRPSRPRLCLAVILALQSLSLVNNVRALAAKYPAYADIGIGQKLLSDVLHGGPLLALVHGLPGSPLLAPAAFAGADRLAGNAGIAVLAAALLAGSTWAAYAAAGRFGGPPVGLIAAGVFAVCLVTSEAATDDIFDPAALCAMAWAAVCAVRFARGDGRDLLLGGVALLVVADYAEYRALWWDPLILALPLLVRPDVPTWRHGRTWNAQRFGLLAAVALTICLVAGRDPVFQAIRASLAPSGSLPLITAAWFAAVGLALTARGPGESAGDDAAAAPIDADQAVPAAGVGRRRREVAEVAGFEPTAPDGARVRDRFRPARLNASETAVARIDPMPTDAGWSAPASPIEVPPTDYALPAWRTAVAASSDSAWRTAADALLDPIDHPPPTRSRRRRPDGPPPGGP